MRSACISVFLGLNVLGTLPATRLNAQTAPTIKLSAPDRISKTVFTTVTTVRELRDGSILVADRSEQRIYKLDWTSGTTVLGRIGDGPGEYRSIGWLYAMRSDSTLLVEAKAGRWSVLSGSRFVATFGADRTFVQLVDVHLLGIDTLGNILGSAGVNSAGSRVPLSSTADWLEALLINRQTGSAVSVARMKGNGPAGKVILKRVGKPFLIFSENPLASRDQAILFADGWIAVARTSPYRVEWRQPTGTWIRGAPISSASVRVTRAEQCAAINAIVNEEIEPCRPEQFPGWPKELPPYISHASPILFAAPDGRLLVRRKTSLAAPGNHYDIFDRRGRIVGILQMKANERVVGWGPRSIYIVTEDVDGLQALSRHPWR